VVLAIVRSTGTAEASSLFSLAVVVVAAVQVGEAVPFRIFVVFMVQPGERESIRFPSTRGPRVKDRRGKNEDDVNSIFEFETCEWAKA